MILTQIGEIGVHHNGETYILKPSLYAMSKIGNPQEILQTYALVMHDYYDARIRWRQFNEALGVINCCTEHDVSHVFGYLNDDLKYVKKAAEFTDILCIARSLLKHGVTGAQKPSKKKEPDQSDYISSFDAAEHVALAIAHLGMSERDAWCLTMTALVSAMRAKFPEPKDESPGAHAPTAEQHDATMEWFEKIKRKRGEEIH